MTQSSSEKIDIESKKEEYIINRWWSELRHGGLLLSPAILEEIFPNGPDKVEKKRIEKLYDAYIKYITNIEKFGRDSSKQSEILYRWIDALFDQFLDLPTTSWIKENKVPDEIKVISYIGEKLRPNRVLTYLKEYRYLIKIDKKSKTLGLGKSKREYAKFLELLRKTKIQLGVYTNGHQIRLIYAGLDHDSWIEWDVERWFEDSIGEELLAGFFHLCGRSLNFKKIDEKWALLHYVQYSRIKQSDLSSVLGNQVREAVEILLETLDLGVRDIPELLDPLMKLEITHKQHLNALYQASIRIIMRLVVVFFAEARELFPRSLERYEQSYGLEGLFRILTEAEQEEGSEILKNNVSGWTRLLALFNLIYDGSPFSDIPIRPYGGVLFRPGNSESDDLTLKAISIFEKQKLNISDFTILRILRKLKIGKVKVKKGRSFTWVHGPVDFSELSAEYIGMMYEGLLDYQVRQVTKEEEAIVILKLGRQPALPITRLESLEDKELKELIQKLSKEKAEQVIKDEESDEEEDEEDDQEDAGEEAEDEEESEEIEEFQTTQEELYQRVLKWAKVAKEKTKKVKKTKKMTDETYEQLLEQEAKKIISREGIYGKGQYYLIQNSGNRKGSGTFYTKPQLVIPTVQRTLKQLVYEEDSDGRTVPKKPETILSMKVCDPAMGSASFLVAALRYISEALFFSLVYHKKVKPHNSNKTVISIPVGTDPSGDLKEDTFTVYATETNQKAEIQIKSRLKRFVMENCIYGVDINSLAVELAKLSLWIETMDRDLPFNFIDHKLKTGNSMIGCYLSDFRDYPLMAWEREAGDSSYNNGVKYNKKEWSNEIKKTRNDIIKNEMVQFIERLKGKTDITDFIENINKETISIKDQILGLYKDLHRVDKFDITKVNDNYKKEKYYFQCFQGNTKFNQLKIQMDLWCAIWFWNPNNLEICPTPLNYLKPSEETIKYVKQLSEKYNFFHWEIEFPDVFFREISGFDAILGNPPWETMQASSMEFFSEYDPIYRTYGKQVALQRQRDFFTKDPIIEREWLNYKSFFKYFKNWIEFLSNPFGDYEIGEHFNMASHWTKSNKLHDQWRKFRNEDIKVNNSVKKFKLQGTGKIYTYKVFLELAIANTNKNGRIGILLPSSIYGDMGAKEMREYLLNGTKWEYLFSFENRKKIFSNIHGSFKFCILIFEKGEPNKNILTAFMRHNLSDWEDPSSFLLEMILEDIFTFSPNYKKFLELENKLDLELIKKLNEDKIILDSILSFYRELNQTDDSKYFKPLPYWEKLGFSKNQYDMWLNDENEIAIPIYEGRMVGQFDFSKKKWLSGKGRTAVWEDIPFDKKILGPQFLIDKSQLRKLGKTIIGYKISYIMVTSATNTRTVVCFLDRDSPHINNCPLLFLKNKGLYETALLTGVLNSLIFDYIMRFRTSGINLNFYVLAEAPLPNIFTISEDIKKMIILIVAKLSFIHIKFAPDWLIIAKLIPEVKKNSWKSNWAITKHQRLQLRAKLDALIAYLYNLNNEELKWILNDNESNPKGFWRVGKDDPNEIRLTTLTLEAFKTLNEIGIKDFCKQDWQIPDKTQKKYIDNLGLSMLEWQLEDSIDNSWKECEEHTRKILGEEKYKEFNNLLNEGKDPFSIWATSDSNSSKTESKNNNKKVNSKQIKSKESKLKFKDIGDFIK